MNRIEALREKYRRHVSIPWKKNLSGPQKVWMAVYPPEEELRLRYRIEEFEIATHESGHGWKQVDFTHAFADWMWEHDYRDNYFEEPDLLKSSLADEFEAFCASRLRQALSAEGVDEDSVVAVVGVGSLFGFMRVSKLIGKVQDEIPGRLLVFFPGDHDSENNVYRLLDARDGWNYMAVAITPSEGLGL